MARKVYCAVLEDLVLECDQDYAGEISVWLAEQELALLGASTDDCQAITADDISND